MKDKEIHPKVKQQIEKKIAEISSLFGGEPVYSKCPFIEKICLFVSRWHYRLTEGLYFKTKYFLQRHIRGYDDLDKWNAAWYIARKSIPVLKAMRNNFVGTSLKWHSEDRFGNIKELSRDEVYIDSEEPLALSEDEWRNILDDIIFSFEFTLKQDDINFDFNEDIFKQEYSRYKRGLKLFSI